MTLTTWGPALDAELTYRRTELRRAWDPRRATRRRARTAGPRTAARADTAPRKARDEPGTCPGTLRGSEAWPAA